MQRNENYLFIIEKWDLVKSSNVINTQIKDRLFIPHAGNSLMCWLHSLQQKQITAYLDHHVINKECPFWGMHLNEVKTKMNLGQVTHLCPVRTGGALLSVCLSFLSVMRKSRESGPLPRLNRHFQVRIWVEEHTFLQVPGQDIWNQSKQSAILRRWAPNDTDSRSGSSWVSE